MSERDLIDLAVRQYTSPQLYVDTDLLAVNLRDIRDHKRETLDALGVTKEQLMSDARFADLLIAEGYDRTKLPVQGGAGGRKLSFAKTHPVMQRMVKNGPTQRIRDLCAARLMVKSTLEETRAERLMNIGGSFAREPYQRLPASIMYYAAHTGRYGGGDKVNLQNLGRGSFLRKAIVPGDGQQILAGDLAQIEARITAYLCGQWDLVNQFRDDIDVYANFASDHYGFKVTKETHPKERFVGKTGILSLGFQSGSEKFHSTMNNVFHTDISFEEASDVVTAYRIRFSHIKDTWKELGDYIRFMATATGGTMEWGPIVFHPGKLVLPNGMPIYYPDLKSTADGYTYAVKGSRKKLYGGALLENIVQALARIVMTRAVDKFLLHNLIPAMSIHDELVFAVKKSKALLMAAAVKGVMEQPVPFMPDLPVKCDVNFGDNYGECK